MEATAQANGDVMTRGSSRTWLPGARRGSFTHDCPDDVGYCWVTDSRSALTKATVLGKLYTKEMTVRSDNIFEQPTAPPCGNSH